MALTYQVDGAELFGAARAVIAHAATAALRQAAAGIQRDGRSNIAGAGFGRSMQNGFVASVFPTVGDSLNPAIDIRHKVEFAGIFETGGTITGNPLLWLPLSRAPLPAGVRSASQYVGRKGRLTGLRRRAGKPPLLAGRIGGKLIPLFVGVAAVTIGKKWDLAGVIARWQAKIPELYDSNLKID